MKRHVEWTRTLCIGLAAVVTFYVANEALFGSLTPHAGTPSLLAAGLEGALSICVGLVVHRVIFKAKR